MAPHALGGKPRSLDVVEEIDFEGDEQKLPRDAKSAIKDTNMVDSSTVSSYSVLSLNYRLLTTVKINMKSWLTISIFECYRVMILTSTKVENEDMRLTQTETES